MASNSNSLRDGFGESEDWIEVYNDSSDPVNLADGYFLSDDPTNPQRWRFPDHVASQLSPQDYLVVFASGRDGVDPEGNLHTSFRLDRDGDYLSLARDIGGSELTVLSEFGSSSTAYPPQRTDIPFGIPFDELIGPESSVHAVVATVDIDTRLGTSWQGNNESTFRQSGGVDVWQSGIWGVGTRPDNALDTYRQLVTGESSLISFYTFDNDDDGHAGIKDVAGSGTHHGTANGAIAFADGVSGAGGKSLSLDGTGYVDLGLVGDFVFPDESLTLEAWLRPTFGPDNRSPLWVGDKLSPAWFGTGTVDRTGRFPNDRYSVRIDANYQGVITTSDDGSRFAATDVDLKRNEWIHVVSVIDGDSVHQYVNGQLVASEGIGGIGEAPTLSRTYLGTSGVGLSWRQHHFVGQIDELSVYEDTLSSETIRQHYESFAFGNEGLFLGNDLTTQMVGVSGSAYARSTFSIDNPAAVSSLSMRVDYTDGYVAYVNGVEVARHNTPETLDHRSLAPAGGKLFKSDSLNITGDLSFLRQGENVLALHAMNSSVDAGGLMVRPQLTAILPWAEPSFLVTATPGEPNSEGFQGFADVPEFDIDRGVFDKPLNVTITAPRGSSLIFTTNGEEPTLTNGALVNPIPGQLAETTVHVDSGLTVVRAASLLGGHMPSRTVTNSYFVFDSAEVANQLGLPRPIAEEHQATIIDSLTEIPSLSLVVDEELMFGSTGIHTLSWRHGRNFEIPVSVEFVDPRSHQEFQIDAGIRLNGDGSRHLSKKQFRVLFRPEYGESELSFPLFEDSLVDEFQTFILRPGAHDSLAFSPFGSLIRDPFLRQTQIDMEQPSARSRFVHLYINGMYRGIYYPTERPDADFASRHLGGAAEDWDSLNAGDVRQSVDVVDGGRDLWDQITTIVKAGWNQGPADADAYASMQQLVDIDNFIDDLILRLWSGDSDWFGEDNYYVIANRTDGGFRFLTWDAEISMGFDLNAERTDVDVNRVVSGAIGTPGGLLSWLAGNGEFQIRFADRLQKHFFGLGAMSTEKMTARWDEFVDRIDGPMVLEAAVYGSFESVQRWQDEVTWVRDNWLQNRNRFVLDDFQEMGLYSPISAPVIFLNGSPHFGGKVTATDKVILADPEGIQVVYTTDGTDPRSVGGGVSSTAIVAQPGTTVTARDGLQLRARVFRDNAWSALVEAEFRIDPPPADHESLRVSEVHFNPPGSNHRRTGRRLR